MSAISQAERDCIMNAALALGAALVAIRNVEDRDIAMASALEVIALASTSDGYSTLANCAVEIRLQAEKNKSDAKTLPDLLREYARGDAAALEDNRIDVCSRRATA